MEEHEKVEDDILISSIDQRIKEVRTESIDLSFGEIISLHTNKELIIQPEFQRLFRWTDKQKSRLIESIILELPIPQIFVVERNDGILELVDGLQRVSSITQFISPELLQSEPLVLEGCDIVQELNGYSFQNLPLRLKLKLKRSAVRTIIIKRQSRFELRYEMFKRLNTGGSLLSPQEIRNVTSRMLGKRGIEFYELLIDLSNYDSYRNTIRSLAQTDFEKKVNEELVLRFFAAKNCPKLFRGSTREWFDTYLELIILDKLNFNDTEEKNHFHKLFDYINRVFEEKAFLTQPYGSFAFYLYESVTVTLSKYLDRLHSVNDNLIRERVLKVIQSSEFRDYTGITVNSKARVSNFWGRIEILSKSIESLFL